MKVDGGFYSINVGLRKYRVYTVDLKMVKKIRKVRTPPLPREWDIPYQKEKRRGSEITEIGEDFNL